MQEASEFRGAAQQATNSTQAQVFERARLDYSSAALSFVVIWSLGQAAKAFPHMPWWASAIAASIVVAGLILILFAVTRSMRQKIKIIGGNLHQTNWLGMSGLVIPLDEAQLAVSPGAWSRTPKRVVVFAGKKVSIEEVARPRDLVEQIERITGRKFPTPALMSDGERAAIQQLAEEDGQPAEVFKEGRSDSIVILPCLLLMIVTLSGYSICDMAGAIIGSLISALLFVFFAILGQWMVRAQLHQKLIVVGGSVALTSGRSEIDVLIPLSEAELKKDKYFNNGRISYIFKTRDRQILIERYQDHERLVALIEERAGREFRRTW